MMRGFQNTPYIRILPKSEGVMALPLLQNKSYEKTALFFVVLWLSKTKPNFLWDKNASCKLHCKNASYIFSAPLGQNFSAHNEENFLIF